MSEHIDDAHPGRREAKEVGAMSRLATWLRTQIDLDEMTARMEPSFKPHVPSASLSWVGQNHYSVLSISRERVLAEVEAKRAIVQSALNIIASFGDWDAADAIKAGGVALWPDANRRERSHAHATIEALAHVYADRPGFDQKWLPSFDHDTKEIGMTKRSTTAQRYSVVVRVGNGDDGDFTVDAQGFVHDDEFTRFFQGEQTVASFNNRDLISIVTCE